MSVTSDDATFADAFDRHRHELQVHAYRMLGSLQEAEDLVQETFLRAWRHRDRFEGRAAWRTWLYRIATNACLDALDSRRSRPVDLGGGYGEVPWLQPIPDELLDRAVAGDSAPEARLVARETIELTFLAAIQHLPPNQRAVLILRDVVGLPAKQVASLLDTSVPSANSALQRARESMQRRLPRQRSEWPRHGSVNASDRQLLARYVDAHERADVNGLAALLSEDVSFSMPPQPAWVLGREPVMRFFTDHGFGRRDRLGDLRLIPVQANRHWGAANYVRKPGDTLFRPLALDVLRFEAGQLVEVTAFEPVVFGAFGLPPTLDR